MSTGSVRKWSWSWRLGAGAAAVAAAVASAAGACATSCSVAGGVADIAVGVLHPGGASTRARMVTRGRRAFLLPGWSMAGWCRGRRCAARPLSATSRALSGLGGGALRLTSRSSVAKPIAEASAVVERPAFVAHGFGTLSAPIPTRPSIRAALAQIWHAAQEPANEGSDLHGDSYCCSGSDAPIAWRTLHC